MGKKHNEKHSTEAQPPEAPEQTLLDDLKRLQADYENYKKRVERDKDQHRQLATEALITDLIPVMDNLDLVLKHADTDPQGLVEGVKMTLQQLHAALESRGLHEIPTDTPFDPLKHEVVATTRDPQHAPNAIITAHQRGYTLGGKTLRPAKVTVNKEVKDA